jgi:post-segregation antitoxin (ccd killing protein)
MRTGQKDCMARKTRAPNKSQFVRKLSSDMPAADVVARARAAGIKLSAAQVYTIRAAAKRQRGALETRPGRKSGANARGTATSSHEREFVTLVLDLGVAQAEAMLARIRSRIGAALG